MNHTSSSPLKVTVWLLMFTMCTQAFAIEIPTIEHYTYKQLILPDDKKIVLVGGCFDILHFGHIQFLQKAKEAGNYLIVALEPDERIINGKHRTPTHTQSERAYNLIALNCVDKVVMLPLLTGFEDYNNLVGIIQPDIIAITENDPQLKNKTQQANLINAECIIVTARISTFSSSAIYKHYQ
jgi:FAD synthetase